MKEKGQNQSKLYLLVTPEDLVSWPKSVEPVYIYEQVQHLDSEIEGVNGLPFLLTIGNTHKLRCELKEATIKTNVLRATLLPETPAEKSSWYKFLRWFNVENLDVRHSPSKLRLTLGSSGGLTLLGVLHLDEMNDITFYVKSIARNVRELVGDLTKRKEAAEARCVINLFGIGIFAYCSIALWRMYTGLRKERLQGLAERHVEESEKSIPAEYVTTAKENRLDCSHCKVKIANLVGECGHLAMCSDCNHMSLSCPVCHEIPKRPVEIFIS